MNKLVVGVSGGPDSIYLLNKLYKQNIKLVVAHVNYCLRDSAFNDESIVKEYCQNRSIPLEILYPAPFRKGNFQRWAREVRYNFFKEIAVKYNYQTIAIGHHQNDLIETYFLQKKRNSIVSYYGLKDETKFNEFTIYRPLLKKTKKDIIEYLDVNQLKYGIDETNYQLKYQRNKLRKEIECLDESQILKILEEIGNLNQELLKTETVNSDFIFQNNIDIDVSVIYQLLKKNGYYYYSNDHLNEIYRQLTNRGMFKLPNGYLCLNDNILIFNKNADNYLVKLNKLEYSDFQYFSTVNQGISKEGVTVKDEDFPLTIRNWKKGDKIQMSYGWKKVSRFFIDQKIPTYLRERWPVVLNSNNQIILVPQLGCDVAHFTNKPNIYVVKYLLTNKGE